MIRAGRGKGRPVPSCRRYRKRIPGICPARSRTVFSISAPRASCARASPVDSSAARMRLAGRRDRDTPGCAMTHYHLMHCVPPDPRVHGLNGYKEVIETVAWGLEQLGHKTTYALNHSAQDATNIVFGAQV